VSLIGDGAGQTVFKLSNAGDASNTVPFIFFVNGIHGANPDNMMTDCTFRDFTIDAYDVDLASYQVGAKGFNVQFGDRIRIQNCNVLGTHASSIGVDFLTNSWITDNVIIDAGRGNDGTHIGGAGIGIGTGGYADVSASPSATLTSGQRTATCATASVQWIGRAVTGTGIPANTRIESVVANTSITLSNAASASGAQTLSVTGPGSLEYMVLDISDNTIEDAGTHGIFLECQASTATNVRSKGIKVHHNTVRGSKYGITDWGGWRAQFYANEIATTTSHGFMVGNSGVAGYPYGGRDGIFRDNVVWGCVGDSVRFEDSASTRYRIENNDLGDGDGYGVYVVNVAQSPDTKKISIKANQITEHQGGGIRISGTAADLRIINNEIWNNGQDTGLTAAYRSGVCLDATCAHITVTGNRMWDDQGTKTQYRALQATAACPALSAPKIFGNDTEANLNSGILLTNSWSGAGVVEKNTGTGVMTKIFTTNGTYTVPVGVTSVKVIAVGGGGGGGGAGSATTSGGITNQAGGGGAGAGASVAQMMTVTPGDTITVTLAAGGTAGSGGAANNNAGTVGGNGGTTTVVCTGTSSWTVSAGGGKAGGASTGNSATGGGAGAVALSTASTVPGCGSAGTSTTGAASPGVVGWSATGGSGGAGATATNGGGGGTGGSLTTAQAPAAAAGASGTTAGVAGSVGSQPGGGGGGGGGGAPGGAGGAGGVGGAGWAMIEAVPAL
jgi:hypothetical protein